MVRVSILVIYLKDWFSYKSADVVFEPSLCHRFEYEQDGPAAFTKNLEKTFRAMAKK